MYTLKFLAVIIAFLSIAEMKQQNEIHDRQINQDYTVVGTFDGYDEEDGYTFVITDENGDEGMMYFQNITPEALKQFNLRSDSLIGERFSISYQILEQVTEDDDGVEYTYEVFTITGLEKL